MADRVAAAVDVRGWLDIYYEIQRADGRRHRWTSRSSGLSGGERRLVILAPMLAAVAARYDQHPPGGTRLLCATAAASALTYSRCATRAAVAVERGRSRRRPAQRPPHGLRHPAGPPAGHRRGTRRRPRADRRPAAAARPRTPDRPGDTDRDARRSRAGDHPRRGCRACPRPDAGPRLRARQAAEQAEADLAAAVDTELGTVLAAAGRATAGILASLRRSGWLSSLLTMPDRQHC